MQLQPEFLNNIVHIRFSSYRTLVCLLFIQGCPMKCMSVDKSQQFSNSFVIWSPSLFSYLNHALTDQEGDLPMLFTQEHGYN